eukprot:gene4549-6421_t
MDPSEFEGTIERQEDALSAGLLESLLHKELKHNSFQVVDLTQELNELYLCIYNLKDSIEKMDSFVPIQTLNSEMDEEALKLSDMKEVYTVRRKQLTANVKRFYNTYSNLINEADNKGNQSEIECYDCEESNSLSSQHLRIVSDCKDLIETFKKEFDYLSSVSRFAEGLFLTAFKYLSSLNDPMVTINECIEVCLKAQEGLKKAQEQLSIADNFINDNNIQVNDINNISLPGITIPSNSNYNNLIKNLETQLEQLKQKEAIEKDELKESYMNEIIGLRSNYQNELRVQEHQLKDHYEKQHLELQSQLENIISCKDMEISSLLKSLNNLNHSIKEAEERSKTLDIEISKRRDLEERLRATLLELSDNKATLSLLQQTNEKLHIQLVIFEEKINNEKLELNSLQLTNQNDIEILKSKINSLEKDLMTRPPANLNNLIEKIGMIGNHVDFDKLNDIIRNNNDDSTLPQTYNWDMIESFIIESMRKNSSEATHNRIHQQELQKRIEQLSNENEEIRNKLAAKSELCIELEKDLMNSNKMMPSQTSSSNYNNYDSMKGSKRLTKSYIYNNSNYNNNAKKFEPIDSESIIDDNLSGGLNINDVVSTNYNNNNDSKMIIAIQNQRDRYMKASLEKDNELNNLSIRLDRLNNEHEQLKKENVELYRRLRVLRLSTNNNNNNKIGNNYNNDEQSHTSVVSNNSNKIRSRMKLSNEDSNSFNNSMENNYDYNNDETFFDDNSNNKRDIHLLNNLDEKYMNMYEQQISPFKIDDFDKKYIMSKLTIFEQILAFVSRNILQDRWARHALMIYLFLVHLLAMGYLIKVLNPQLIEEVDEHLRSKWSYDAMSHIEHPDNSS